MCTRVCQIHRIRTEVLVGPEREVNPAIGDNIEEDITLGARSQKRKGKFSMISLIRGIEKNQTYSNREKNSGDWGLEGGEGGEADQRVQTFTYR